MQTARAPWADKYLSTINNAFSYAESLEDPDACDRALNALHTLYDAYFDMGYFGHDFKDMETTFNIGDMPIGEDLAGIEKMLPEFKRAVYDFTRACSERGMDPDIFFGQDEADYVKFGAGQLKYEANGEVFPGMLTPSSPKGLQKKLDSENIMGFQN